MNKLARGETASELWNCSESPVLPNSRAFAFSMKSTSSYSTI